MRLVPICFKCKGRPRVIDLDRGLRDFQKAKRNSVDSILFVLPSRKGNPCIDDLNDHS